MSENFDESYSKDLNNPLYISKCEKAGLKKKIKGFFIKEILPKLENIEEIQNDITFSWDELLEKLLNSKKEVDQDTLETVMEIALFQKIIDENLSNINNVSKKL